MAVRIRLKKMGRAHRPFYRVCAIDKHTPRDGRVLEELGTYDTSVADTDARAVLKTDRIDYWLSVGAQPSDNVAVLIKKYGADGTHQEQQKAALLKLAEPKMVPAPGAPASMPKKEEEPKEAEKAAAPEETAKAKTAKPKTANTDKPKEEAAVAEAPAESPAAEATSEEETSPAKE